MGFGKPDLFRNSHHAHTVHRVIAGVGVSHSCRSVAGNYRDHLVCWAGIPRPYSKCRDAPDTAADADWDAVDEITAAKAAGLRWSHLFPSRDLEIARQFKRLFGAQSLALSSAGEAMRRRARGRADLAPLEADIDESMRAVGESLTYLRARIPIP